ncbi:MAG TPA: P1 family peptidase [Candidatus Aminicenantes bacterium]|nr:P1 family peptidase [Candidatus Aminicenantes bacterium]
MPGTKKRKPFAAAALGAVVLCAALAGGAGGQSPKPRARDLGVPFDGAPGAWNAITDVAGVEVGMTTLVSGTGRLVAGRGPVRTGVTAVFPRPKAERNQVFAAWSKLNGNGEMTGTAWLEESGFLEGPVLVTNTHSVGVVRDAVIAWQLARLGDKHPTWSLPVVAETWDGDLNDINGFHVKPEHVFRALDGAKSGPVAEGNVGGGTGMIVHGFKGGTGTSSRRVTLGSAAYTVGVLVQANYGVRDQLTIAGVPVGREIPDLLPEVGGDDAGSIIAVVATDAPLLPHQLRRMAERVTLGIGRTGGLGGNGSGDIFVAFSTANAAAAEGAGLVEVEMLPNEWINPLFAATVQATEEAVVNAMVAAETMEGVDGHVVHAIPHDRLRAVLRKYGRLAN